MILNVHGQSAEIRRDGYVVATVKALIVDKEGLLKFLPDTDIKAGDEVLLVLSEKLHTIDRVDKHVQGQEVVSVRAYHSGATRKSAAAVTVHGSYIQAGTITNSALQLHSPNAVQNQKITIGADQKDKVKEALRLVLEVLDELNLSDEDKAEVKSDATAADAQVESPKTKWQHVKDYLAGIRDKVKEGIAGKVAATVVAKGQAALQAINDFLTSSGGQ